MPPIFGGSGNRENGPRTAAEREAARLERERRRAEREGRPLPETRVDDGTGAPPEPEFEPEPAREVEPREPEPEPFGWEEPEEPAAHEPEPEPFEPEPEPEPFEPEPELERFEREPEPERDPDPAPTAWSAPPADDGPDPRAQAWQQRSAEPPESNGDGRAERDPERVARADDEDPQATQPFDPIATTAAPRRTVSLPRPQTDTESWDAPPIGTIRVSRGGGGGGGGQGYRPQPGASGYP
jgi:hypothetical protein